MAEPADLPGLRHWFDHLLGVRGENTWICRYEGLPLTLALYPFFTPSEDAGNSLPRHLVDTRQGLAFWRNQWGGAGPDTGRRLVCAFHLRFAWSQSTNDAGSIRMICKGIPWICGAGQAPAGCPLAERPHPCPTRRPSVTLSAGVSIHS